MSEQLEIWQRAALPLGATIQDAIENLNEVRIKIVLVVNQKKKLEGTISDGDIRRGLLRGLNLGSPIDSIVHRNAFVVPLGMERDTVLQLMLANNIQQIPVVGNDQEILGLHLWDEISTPLKRSNIMVIMAGGKGTRLMPHTQNCPKPMIEVAGKPILQHIIERTKSEGFSRFIIAIHHLGHMIEDYFGDGEKFSVHIDYLREETPLGTAGALSLLQPHPEAPFVVTNGDVITDIRYGELLDFHARHDATATMAVRLYEWEHPFGVVQMNGVEITGFEEKPIARSHINAGVYILSPEALTELSIDTPCDMPTLFDRLRDRKERIVAYPMYEPWLDVGRPDDLTKANKQTD